MEKLSFDSVRKSMSYFIKIDQVEDEMEKELSSTVSKVIKIVNNGGDNDIEKVTRILSDHGEEGLKAILSIMPGSSLEKLKRLTKSEYGMTYKKALNTIPEQLASFFNEPTKSSILPPYLAKVYELPDDWEDKLKDVEVMTRLTRASLLPKYNTRMGLAIENSIQNEIRKIGFSCEKGHLDIVDQKEMDVIIPSKSDPRIVIMVSYCVTTTSYQTDRADVQLKKFNSINEYNLRKNRKNTDVQLVSVTDGGGWIERIRDHERMYDACHQCFTMNNIDEFKKYVTWKLSS